jgi:hypothetical protein
VAPVAAGVLLTESAPAAVRIASRADWAPPAAAAASVGVLVLAGWTVTRKRGPRGRE